MSDIATAKTGLIVVDLQKAFAPAPELVSGVKDILGNYDVIVATQFLNRPGSLYETELNYQRCQLGSSDSDLVLAMKPNHVFDRFSYGLQPNHVAALKEYKGIYRWDIVGCDTEACVLATCYALWDAGIRFHVIKELCQSSGGDGPHQAGLTVMRRSFGQ